MVNQIERRESTIMCEMLFQILSRIQTPRPASGGFKEIFNKVGGKVSEAWDAYLRDVWEGRSMNIVHFKGCTDNNADSSDCSPGEGQKKSLSKEYSSRKEYDASVPWHLPIDKDGWPILPLELALPLPRLKEIIQSFLTITYHTNLLSLMKQMLKTYV